MDFIQCVVRGCKAAWLGLRGAGAAGEITPPPPRITRKHRGAI